MFTQYILPILLAMAIMIGLSGLFAFLLSFLGNKLQVERDPKIDDVIRHLSGANCGGCGFAGCQAYAQALVEGKTTLNACNPTQTDAKNKIAKILGMSEIQSKETVAVVHCKGGHKCRNKYEYQGYGNCVSSELLSGGNKACDWGCIGLGSCTSNCKYEAISVDKDNNFALVDDRLCISCGACVSVCPKRIISRIPKSAKVYIACSNTNKGRDVVSVCDVGCIACGKCVKACPYEAITLENNLAVIDYDKCTSCGECVQSCPRKTIINKAAKAQ